MRSFLLRAKRIPLRRVLVLVLFYIAKLIFPFSGVNIVSFESCKLRKKHKKSLMSCFACFLIAAVVVLLWFLIRSRVLPVIVMRVWFGLVMFNVLVASNLLTFVADSLKYVGVSADTRKLLCTYVCVVTFRCAIFFNPHIRVRVDERRQKWADIPEPSVMALNHTSFWDAFVFVGSAPVKYIYNCKTLMKASLRKLPIFGPVFDRVGHFPVYFKTSSDGDFSVDKEKQAVVAEQVNIHIAKSGKIAVFPEGAVNKQPTTLSNFRHGSFALVVQHKLKVYYCLMVGNNDSWPAAESMGGYPADIDVVIGHFPVDFATTQAPELAAKLQQVMQQELDEMLAARAKRCRSGSP